MFEFILMSLRRPSADVGFSLSEQLDNTRLELSCINVTKIL